MTEYEAIHSRSPVFYTEFARKEDLQHQTHYCPGCGHGVISKLIAEAIEDFGLQENAVFVNPVGCSVFGFQYFDMGHVAASHGRAPAVATGLSRALPDKVVIAYQGDGDLAAIGTAEILHAANRGENIAVFFANNAIYGMTGGQLAPTTLVGQTSTTSPWGRRAKNDGFPLRVCELLSQLEAPVYIERVAITDPKNIMRARRAVRKALELQKQHAGFTLVELLSPCPTIWKKDPSQARAWIAEQMIPTFPLGVFRDRTTEAGHPLSATGGQTAGTESVSAAAADVQPPHPSLPEVLELKGRKDARTSTDRAAARHQTRPLTVKVAGFGGQGVLLAGQLLIEIGMREGMEVTWLPSYGPEMRGGAAHCHVCLSHERIGSPLITHPEVLVAMNEQSLRKFAGQVVSGGLILYSGQALPSDFAAPQAHVVCVPATELADHIGSPKVSNIIMLGALLKETGCLPLETALEVLDDTVKNRSLAEMNRRALQAGAEYIEQHMRVGAVSQPDGFAY